MIKTQPSGSLYKTPVMSLVCLKKKAVEVSPECSAYQFFSICSIGCALLKLSVKR